MADYLHLSQLQKILKHHHAPMTLQVWTKSGAIMTLKNCISLRNDFKKGTRLVKMLDSGEKRMIYDCCIFTYNDLKIFL